MQLTHTQLTDILAESPTMRSIIATAFLASQKPYLAVKIEEIILTNGKNKIASIKAVRELAPAKDFAGLYPINLPTTDGGFNTLGLADSKRLVEYVAEVVLRKPYESFY